MILKLLSSWIVLALAITTLICVIIKAGKRMTEREACEQIIENEGCEDRICEKCHLDELFGDSCNTYTSLQLAKEHLAKLDKEVRDD